MASVLVALGSNLGNRPQTLDRAVEMLRDTCSIDVRAVSRWHEFSPVGGPGGQVQFLNGAARLETTLEPEALLDELHRIEWEFGRRRSTHWASRPLDLDLLLYGAQTLSTDHLIVPHPRTAFRRFVLAPAAEIAADWVHPEIGWTIGRLLEHLDSAPNYLALAGASQQLRHRLSEEIARQAGATLIADPVEDDDDLDGLKGESAGLVVDSAIRFLARAEAVRGGVDLADPTWSVSDYWIPQVDSVDMPQPKIVAVIESTDHNSELNNILAQGGHGPVVRLDPDDPARAVVEATAAIEATRK